MKKINIVKYLVLCFFLITNLFPQNWPQFRGINCSGIAESTANPPAILNESTLRWKTPLEVGHSSPCVWGDHIYVTSFIKERNALKTICIGRTDGKIKWEKSIFPEKIEGYHEISNAAQTTPAADENGVYIHFGSTGVLHYDVSGNLVWEYPITVPKHNWGASSSPIIYQNLLIISRDIRNEEYLLALDKNSGKLIWKVNYQKFEIPFSNGSATPVIFKNSLIIHQRGGIAAYSTDKGKIKWWLPIVTGGSNTPVVDDQFVYIGTWHNYSEEEDRGDLPKYVDFNTVLKDFDADKNGLVAETEIPENFYLAIRTEIPDLPGASHKVKQYFDWFDQDKNSFLDKKEWDAMIADESKYWIDGGLIAISLESKGKLSEADIHWRVKKNVPEVPAPIISGENIYMIKNGGTITCANLKSGEVHFCERLGVAGPYIASPVAANGRIYIPTNKGVITVITATNELNILAKNDLNEKIYATPAIAGNTIYIRTTTNLYAFGKK